MALNEKRVSAITLSALTAAMLTFSGCGGSSSSSTTTPPTEPTAVELSGEYTSDMTLDATKVYAINGEVSFKSGATLTIPAGTKLYGKTGASYLAIDQGAKIDAQGTADKPIIFTSAEDVAGSNTGDEQGQWGGLSIFGTATTNKGLETYEAGDHTFGCDPAQGVVCNDADNSGVLKYVIIKHSGYEVEVDKELNGLSLGGVGSGTVVENVVVAGSLDDGIEVWGGKVDLKNVYLYNNADDSLDWDHGWTGSATNVYIEQNEVDGTGSRGIESDNNGGSEADAPISNPTITNFTIITAAAGGQGIVNREGTAGDLQNGIIVTNNAGKANIEVRSAATLTQGLTYTNMVLGQSAGLHYAGHAEDTADKIYGTTTATEVQTLVEAGGVNVSTSTDVEALQTASPSAGADMSAFEWYTSSPVSATIVTLSGQITADKTLDATKIYAIDGEVSVKAPATLTIPAGTTLFGKTGASYLAIDQGAKIDAQGTAANPIVFTSAQDIAGSNTGDEQGQWGGLSIFGTATSNKGLETYEAGDHTFGCDDATVTCNDADNSGVLKYVIIKHSGYEVEVDKELNGLSLGGVGSGTVVENVAVIGSLDDGVEVWGGTVAMTNVYLYNNADDSLDWDHGWTGSATNVYIEQNEVDGTGSRGIESDNNGGSEADAPISNPTITKFTIITAAAGGQGIVNREGTAGDLRNGIIVTNNAGKANIEVRSAATLTQGLTYTNMVLGQSAGLHYAGHAEDTADKIYGTTTATEVQTLVENGGVVVDTTTDADALQSANPTTGADKTAFIWVK